MKEYVVGSTDTLEKISALHDLTTGELMRANRLQSRMIFPGQKLKIPDPIPIIPKSNSNEKNNPQKDAMPQCPGVAVRTKRNSKSPDPTTNKENESLLVNNKPEREEVDQECLQRFLKLKVKQITENEGSVVGTLLVTPNCLMFDPDVNHPLVVENGADKYGMVAPMEQISSAALYQDISAMQHNTDLEVGVVNKLLEQQAKDGVTDKDLDKLSNNPTERTLLRRHASHQDLSPEDDVNSNVDKVQKLPNVKTPVKFQKSDTSTLEVAQCHPPLQAKSCSNLPDQSLIDHEMDYGSFDIQEYPKSQKRKTTSTSSDSERYSMKRFGNFKRSLGVRASTIGGSLSSGAKAMATGTSKAVSSVAYTSAQAAGAIVSTTKQTADAVNTATKQAVNHARQVPTNIVNMSSGLFADITESGQSPMRVDSNWVHQNRLIEQQLELRRQQSMATFELLKEQSAQRKAEVIAQHDVDSPFHCATDATEKPDLFKSVDELLTPRHSICINDELPFYLCITLNRRRHRKRPNKHANRRNLGGFDRVAFGNKERHQFWYTVPRGQADQLYTFLLRWQPVAASQAVEEDDKKIDDQSSEECGFLIIDANNLDENLKTDEMCGYTPVGERQLNRAWEIVTVEEVRRRLSISDMTPMNLPLPKGCQDSKIFTESMLHQIVQVLPTRAEGYPWISIYNSDHHGFSLKTLYRRMNEWAEELSPTLLVIKDTNQRVFGACVSNPILPNDHFYGRGESTFLFTFVPVDEGVLHSRRQVSKVSLSEDALLADDPLAMNFMENQSDEIEYDLQVYTYTGTNENFVKASIQYLAIGAASGHNGIWLDADLNRGRTQPCATFDNECLTFNEDFVIRQVEAWGFSIDAEPWK